MAETMTLSAQQALELALQSYRVGRMAEAEGLCWQILAAEPGISGACHLLGVIAHQSGRHDLAVEWFDRALALDPRDPSFHINKGEACRGLGRLNEAEAAYRRALAIRPDFAEAHNNLGIALAGQHRYDEAAAAFRRAVELRPAYAEAMSNLGIVFSEQGLLDEAGAAHRRSIEIMPGYPEAYHRLGKILRRQGRAAEAAAAFRRALELRPGWTETALNLGIVLRQQGLAAEAEAVYRRVIETHPESFAGYNNLGNALQEQGRLEEAGAALRRALQINPESAEVHSNLGTLALALGHFDEALAALQKAFSSKPNLPEVRGNLAVTLLEKGRYDDAITACRQALAASPDDALVKFNYGCLLLLHGDFENGWPLYEARQMIFRSAKRNFSQPVWDGRALAGGRILIHAEQGLGDCLQFIRYAPFVVERGGHVVLECPRSLVELLRGAKGVHEVVADGDPLPSFDVHLPMLSLPLIFRTAARTIPRAVPYLSAPPARRAAWRDRIKRDRSRLRAGLVWAGSPEHRRNPVRNIPLRTLLPLLRVETAEFYSLQLGAEVRQIQSLPEAVPLIDLTAHLHDLADTAAFMEELDVVITVDTAAAHLAGALGRPVWTLLPFVPDWRWGLESERTPWYPTMRLFRQPAHGDWDSVVQRVASELLEMRQAMA